MFINKQNKTVKKKKKRQLDIVISEFQQEKLFTKKRQRLWFSWNCVTLLHPLSHFSLCLFTSRWLMMKNAKQSFKGHLPRRTQMILLIIRSLSKQNLNGATTAAFFSNCFYFPAALLRLSNVSSFSALHLVPLRQSTWEANMSSSLEHEIKRPLFL